MDNIHCFNKIVISKELLLELEEYEISYYIDKYIYMINEWLKTNNYDITIDTQFSGKLIEEYLTSLNKIRIEKRRQTK